MGHKLHAVRALGKIVPIRFQNAPKHHQIIPPRKQDGWIMRSFADIGYNLHEQAILNRVRQHQQVVFDSDPFDASGLVLDPKYLRLCQPGERWSEWNFGRQCINQEQLKLWQEALGQLAPRRRRAKRLGDYLSPGHKVWDWCFEEESGRLQYEMGNTKTIFCAHGERGGRNQQYVCRTSSRRLPSTRHIGAQLRSW